tara:strand:- start:59945 stop:60955 length:1011 start_codon:yes stop_codon:yes gene_type:complete
MVYIFAKILAPFFGEYFQSLLFGSKKKRNSDIDFDHLIEQKKAYLRGDVTTDPLKKGSSQNQSHSTYTQKLHQEFNKLSALKKKNDAQSKRSEELKELLQIIDSFQWGESKTLNQIAKNLSTKIGHRLEAAQVTQAFKELMKREILIGKNNSVLGLKATTSMIETYLYLKVLYSEKELQSQKARAWGVSALNLKKALFLYTKKLKSEERSDDLANVLKKQTISLPSTQDTFILSALLKRSGLSLAVITKELKDIIELFKILEPLPPLKNKKDRETALKILGLPSSCNEAQIKKQYKTLAKLKHPDRLRGKGIPAEFDKIATENFTQIKKAYDILMG